MIFVVFSPEKSEFKYHPRKTLSFFSAVGRVISSPTSAVISEISFPPFVTNVKVTLPPPSDMLSDVLLFFFPHATSDVALTSVMRSRTSETRIIFLDLNLFFIVAPFGRGII